MSRTNTTFGLLQAIAAVAGLAIILWSLGLPALRFAEAANVTSLSDTLSDSAPGVVSDHTIVFATPTGVAEGETITIDFSDGPFDIGSVDFSDIDVFEDATSFSVDADCSGAEVGAEFTGEVLEITLCSGQGAAIPASGTSTILIGLNAAGGDAQLTNPVADSYEINVTAGPTDSGSTRVAIIAPVVVTAAVDTSFTFTVGGVNSGTVNGELITGTSTATEIPFGTLEANTASTAAQQLSVTTNASYGFAVTVQVDQQLTSSSGADIDGYKDGSFTTTPLAWDQPGESIGNEDSWGHWGLTSDDETLTNALDDPFDVGGVGQLYVSASTTPVEVFRHDGPADGTTQNVGTARVGYKVEISPLQEAGNDYTATLTYVATPVF